MFRVREVFDKEAKAVCERFSLATDEYDRVFCLDGESGGVGLTRLEDGAIRIGKIVADGDDPLCEELIFRTLLLDATRVKNFKVVIEREDGDFKKYGFERAADGTWTANSDNIIFPHDCCGH